MENIDKLLEIARFLGLSNNVKELESIDYRAKQSNASLLLPLVGEFSSGKTTLINALTDSKKLETAAEPTTATIYEVHFGCDKCHAIVITENGNIQEVDDISDLKNKELANAKVVTVYDTSTRVPATTILVDTPGLSSPEPKHKQTLVNFLPRADGILLVSDINQQLTRSLADFIETMKLSKRPLYLVLTMSDTKSATEIDAAKKYIVDNCQIPLNQIAVVSAKNGELQDLYSLLDNIQKNKKEILKQVDGQRVKNIVSSTILHIETLMSASNSDKELEEAVRRSQYELDKIKRNIDRLIDTMSDDIEEKGRNATRRFEDTVFSRLNTLVTGKSSNFDAEAISVINSTATLLMNDYKISIKSLLREHAQSQKGSENEVPLSSLENIDLSSIQMSGLSYNLDLNTMGHEYDGLIKAGVYTVATVGTVAAVVATGGGAAGTIASAATVDNVIDVADTVTDIGSMISNQRTVGQVQKAIGTVANSVDRNSCVNVYGQQINPQACSDKGMIDSLVGFVTDKLMSKPQRVRAIRNYIDGILLPEFKSGLVEISHALVGSIRANLQEEASVVIGEKTEALNQLRQELKDKKDQFEKTIAQLREYKTFLLTI